MPNETYEETVDFNQVVVNLSQGARYAEANHSEITFCDNGYQLTIRLDRIEEQTEV